MYDNKISVKERSINTYESTWVGIEEKGMCDMQGVCCLQRNRTATGLLEVHGDSSGVRTFSDPNVPSVLRRKSRRSNASQSEPQLTNSPNTSLCYRAKNCSVNVCFVYTTSRELHIMVSFAVCVSFRETISITWGTCQQRTRSYVGR